MKLKICGLKDPKNIVEIAELKPDFIGFIFYEGSKRFIADTLSEDVLGKIPSGVNKVGVFVNEDIDTVIEKCNNYKLDYVQLHGDEDQSYCARLFIKNIPVIKAFAVGNDFDFTLLKEYTPYCKYFLFDTRGKSRGGTGLKFDWELLKSYKLMFPFIISGGIDDTDLELISKLSLKQLCVVDINSKFEISPGIKDVEKSRSFYSKLKLLNH